MTDAVRTAPDTHPLEPVAARDFGTADLVAGETECMDSIPAAIFLSTPPRRVLFLLSVLMDFGVITSTLRFCSQSLQMGVNRTGDARVTANRGGGRRGCFAICDFQLRLQFSDCDGEFHRIFDRGKLFGFGRIFAKYVHHSSWIFSALDDDTLLDDIQILLDDILTQSGGVL